LLKVELAGDQGEGLFLSLRSWGEHDDTVGRGLFPQRLIGDVVRDKL
jgi:hypothetical protein